MQSSADLIPGLAIGDIINSLIGDNCSPIASTDPCAQQVVCCNGNQMVRSFFPVSSQLNAPRHQNNNLVAVSCTNINLR